MAPRGHGSLAPARGYFTHRVARRKSQFTEQQIVGILKQHEAGVKVADLCREHGISNATFYQWKAKYGGMDASQLRQVKDLQEENARLKRMYAELSMMHDALKQVVEKKWGA
jgi:putative transposase